MKQNECNDLRSQNRALMEENARSRAFIERLLRHQAFTPFLEELSRDESLQSKPAMTALQSAPTPAPAPVRQNQQFNGLSQPDLHIGMTTIPETQLDMSMLNLNSGNFAMNNMGSFNYQQPQVFAVLELPEGPSNPIDTDALSGKGHAAFSSEAESVSDEIKPDFPLIERPIESAQAAPVESAEEDDDCEFELYRSSPALTSSVAAPIEDHEPLFGAANPEKVFAHFELFVSDEGADQELMERFERMCAAMEPAFQRIAAMTSHLDS
jgi:hypothetical protein